jgi:tripartite-type tricarboxylate transporter receptor subunit TctC
MKSLLSTAAFTLAFALGAGAALAEFPEKSLAGVIQWGAGGSTDAVMRSVAPHVEEKLGQSIVLTNRTGGVGVLATRYVQSQRADGYTLLMGAENPQLYKVMGLADVDYADFIPINVLARGIPILVAHPDAPFDSIPELIAYAQANPGTVKMGSTGPGGLPSMVGAMLQSEVELPVTAVPFDGDGPALTAMQGGAVDFMPAVLGAAIEHIKAGRIKPLGIVDLEENPALPGVKPIVADYPDFAKYLPWGPFFGVFVHEDTPLEAVDVLVEAFHYGAEQPEFVQLIEDRGFIMLDLSGQEAADFLERWQSVSSWIAFDGGLAGTSPEEFGIPRP